MSWELYNNLIGEIEAAEVLLEFLIFLILVLMDDEKEVNLPVGGRLFHHKQVWKELGLPKFCQEVVYRLKVLLLSNFKLIPNSIPISILECQKSDWGTNEFTVPKPGTTLHRPVLDSKILNTYIKQSIIQDGRNQESTINGQTRLLHGKTRYQESLPPRIFTKTRYQEIIPPHISSLKKNIDITDSLWNSFIRALSGRFERDVEDPPRQLIGLKFGSRGAFNHLRLLNKKLDFIDVLFGNDILKDSIINQKDKIIKLNNSTYKINYQQSNQLHCNIKAPRKHVTQICDILAKTNPEEEEIRSVREFINDSFEDVIVDKLHDIPDQINNSRRRHVEEMVIKFIDLGIIKRSESNYSSPIMLLKKRDSWRVVHDYRQLNKVTFDMIMGHFQVLINPEHVKYTAFITHIGKFEYTRIPQGLVNSPSTFARLMVEIFGKIKNLLQYYDDLLVHSKLDYIEKHLKLRRKTYHISKESKGKNKKTLSDGPLIEFNNLKKDVNRHDNHSDNNNLNNGSFHLYYDVSDKALSCVLYQIQGDKFKVIWFLSRKLTKTQKRYSIGDREFLSTSIL
ncbi:hypothetical protein ACTFIW_005426 [Dictyostelium discoideum]